MKLSIITINYNNAEELMYTLESSFRQTCQDFEHIIIDGGSIDGSVEVIKAFASKICATNSHIRLKWLSEKDNGIFNAMNKGIELSTGEYLLFLNGGDAFASNTIVDSLLHQGVLSGEDVIIGKQNLCRGHIIYGCNGLKYDRLTLFNYYMFGLPHQATLTHRRLFEKNLYDESLKINSDWKFYFEELILNNASWKKIDITIANFDTGGISASNTKLLWAERERVFRSLVSPAIAEDYLSFLPMHYYEAYRLEWLIKHPMWYKFYRAYVTLGRKLMR